MKLYTKDTAKRETKGQKILHKGKHKEERYWREGNERKKVLQRRK